MATDYRDFRKSAFQEYAVVCCFNAIKIPKGIDPYEAASLGVAFVTAALSLGICLGVVLPRQGKLPDLDLLATAQGLGPERVPSDCLDEVFSPIPRESRPRKGEWIMIYGGEYGDADSRFGPRGCGCANPQYSVQCHSSAVHPACESRGVEGYRRGERAETLQEVNRPRRW